MIIKALENGSSFLLGFFFIYINHAFIDGTYILSLIVFISVFFYEVIDDLAIILFLSVCLTHKYDSL